MPGGFPVDFHALVAAVPVSLLIEPLASKSPFAAAQALTTTLSTIAAPLVPDEKLLAALSSSSLARFVLMRKHRRTVPPLPVPSASRIGWIAAFGSDTEKVVSF